MNKTQEKLHAKYMKIADSLASDIKHKLADREINTDKKRAFAMNARTEAYHLKRVQSLSLKLAELALQDSIPIELMDKTTKKALMELVKTKTISGNYGWHSYRVDTNETYNNDPATLAAFNLINASTNIEDNKARKLDELKLKLSSIKIDGFFPTPSTLTKKMVNYAEIKSTDNLLEPNGGNGAILEQLIANGVSPQNITVYEINSSLFEYLMLKYGDTGMKIINGDFLESDTREKYDKILMNPPFENKQDIKHTKHAFEKLEDGGTLVGILSSGVTFRQGKLTNEFREFISLNGTIEDIPSGTFKESGTMVGTVLVKLEK